MRLSWRKSLSLKGLRAIPFPRTAARMVDISDKPATQRTATATGKVYLKPETLKRIRRRTIEKGEVLSMAQTAGIMAAKKVPDLIPLCHPLPLTSVEIHFREKISSDRNGRSSLGITASVKSMGRTGVEMEAMAAVCVAALTVYDMCKAVDRGISFGEIMLLKKMGGRSGTYKRDLRKK